MDKKNEKNEKNEKKFVCELCDYKCSYYSDWCRHTSTRKHVFSVENTGISKKTRKTSEYICDCGCSYFSKTDLKNHKSQCQSAFSKNEKKRKKRENENLNPLLVSDPPSGEMYDIIKHLLTENNDLKTIICQQNMKVIEQNTKFAEQNQTIMKELTKWRERERDDHHHSTHSAGTHNETTTHIHFSNNHISQTNSNNKSFNLNFFLNETCKNAMNIGDFMNSIQIQLSDLDNFGKMGYVEGMSKIILNNLNNLDETMRPIHCTDKKREIFYVKDENKWEREDENKQKIKRVINFVSDKNMKLLPQFREKYPECKNPRSPASDKYDKMMVELMGCGGNEALKQQKIIRNISNATVIQEK